MSAPLSAAINRATPREPAAARGPGLPLFAGMLLAALAAGFLVWSFQFTGRLYGSDWQTFYEAALRLRSGRQVYTVAHGFFNPPPFLLLVLPFTMLPYIPSRLVWATLSAAMLLASAAMTGQVAGWRPSRRDCLLAAWWLLLYLPTVLLAPITGNFTALSLLGFTLSLWLFSRGREGWAGAALALTLVKPQLAFLGLPLLLYKRRWRACAGYLGATALAALLTMPIVGWQTFVDYAHVQAQVSTWTHTNDAMQVDVPGIHGMFLALWPRSAPAEVLADLCSLALVGTLAWLWRGAWQPAGRRFAVCWAALLVVTLLTASFAHTYDLTLLILPAVVLYALGRRPDAAPAAARAWAGPLLVALYVAPVLHLTLKQHFLVPPLLAALVVLWRSGAALSSRPLGDAPQPAAVPDPASAQATS